MTQDAKELAALLGSRICHDLISPIGAIGNGLELIAMSGLGNTPELSLISDSVTNANARIRFYRVAYGTTADDQSLPRQEIVSILAGVMLDSRLSVDWQPPGEVRRSDAKLLFLLIQCCESAMPYGGTITVSRDGQNWQIAGLADKLKPMDPVWTLLTDPQADVQITPGLVQFGLVRPALHDAGRSLRLNFGAQGIHMSM
jgi:histidine phosphotransferase ChpT